jgi:tetratricopeptide (TPR) repeat protein
MCGSLAIFIATVMLAGCPTPEHDVGKAAKRVDLAIDFLAKRQLEAAETECNRAIALNPASEVAYNTRGLVNMLRAIDQQRSLEIDDCLTGLDAEAGHKNLDKALKLAGADFEKAYKLHPEYGDAWSNRGVVATLLEDYPTAITALTKALENPNRLADAGLTRAHLGWVYFRQQKYVEAATELRNVRQFAPKMCVATYRLGRVYFAREEWDKAAELLETASNDPSCGSQEASLYLMKTRMQQGLVDDARHARDACLKMSPESCVAQQCSADGGALGKGNP